MPSMNRVLLMGNLTRDPELRELPSGSKVTDMRMAISENYKNRAGEQVETTCYVDVAAWGRQAETCQQYLQKGSPIFVEGRLRYDEWETDEGQKRSKLRVRADRVQFLGSPRDRDREGAGVPRGGAPVEDQPPLGGTTDEDAPF